MFVSSRSSRDMPGFRAMPDVMTTTSESAVSFVAVRAHHIRVRAHNGPRLQHVKGFALRQPFYDVDEHHVCLALVEYPLCGRRTDISGPDYGYLASHFVSSSWMTRLV